MPKTPEEIQQEAARRITAARDNADLSDDARLRAIATAYVQARDGLAELQDANRTTAAARRSTLERTLFGIPGTADANQMISYRDALDRVERIPMDDITGERQALDLLNRAATSGDDLLVRAVLAAAFERPWVDVIQRYSALNPTTDSQIEELWTLRIHDSTPSMLIDAVTHFAEKPKELGTMSDWAISELAAGGTSRATAPTTGW